MGVRLTPEEAWGGGSITAVTLELGVTGDEDKFLSALNVEGSPSSFGFNWDPMAIGLGKRCALEGYSSDHWGECFGFGSGGCHFSGGVLCGGVG